MRGRRCGRCGRWMWWTGFYNALASDDIELPPNTTTRILCTLLFCIYYNGAQKNNFGKRCDANETATLAASSQRRIIKRSPWNSFIGAQWFNFVMSWRKTKYFQLVWRNNCHDEMLFDTPKCDRRSRDGRGTVGPCKRKSYYYRLEIREMKPSPPPKTMPTRIDSYWLLISIKFKRDGHVGSH